LGPWPTGEAEDCLSTDYGVAPLESTIPPKE
jgi:hypothetical protein